MHVVLATYGTRGDVEPMVGLAVALRERGAQVRMCAPPDEDFAALLARAGVPMVPFARSWRSWATEGSTAEERVPDVDAYVGGHIAATYETLAREAAAGCDVLVATGMVHFVARSVAETVGVPLRFVVFSPTIAEPKPYHERVRAPLDAHRASLGLAPLEDVRTFLLTERPWVAADPVLSPPDASADVERTAAWILSDERPLDRDLMAFLDAGDAPVYVGFGSMRVPPEIAREAVEAIRGQGRRVLVGRGWAGLDAIDGADDCRVVGEVNQQALFERCAVVVHHGGAGTTTTAALAGAPQVIVPQAADQPHWAARVAELGIGVAHEGPTPTRASLAAALHDALSLQTYERATEVAAEIRTDGTAEAAERLLAEVAR